MTPLDNPGMPIGHMITHPDLPLPEALAPSAPGPDNPESGEELWLGKYKSKDEAEKGHWELQRTLTDRERRLAEAEAKAQAYEQMLAERLGQGPAAPQSDPFQELDTLGIPRETLLKAVDAMVVQRLTPITEGLRAQAAFESKHPEYQEHRQGVAEFIASDTTLVKDFNDLWRTNAYRAQEWAFDRYREAKKLETPTSAADDPTRAALPSGGASPTKSGDDAATIAARLKQARDYYNTYGDKTPFLQERLINQGVLPWGWTPDMVK